MESIYIVNPDKRLARCPYCNYETDRKNNLKRHIVTMHYDSSKILDCCGEVFKSKAALRDHVSACHKSGYRCHVCSRNFCRKALLRRHLTVHSGEKEFRCSECPYATSHKSNLERHQKIHSKVSELTSSPKTAELIENEDLISKPDERTKQEAFTREDSNVKLKSHFKSINQRSHRIMWKYKSLLIDRKCELENNGGPSNKHSYSKQILPDNCEHELYDLNNTDTEVDNNFLHSVKDLQGSGQDVMDWSVQHNVVVSTAPAHPCGTVSRLWLKPYKCHVCKENFQTQQEQENHGCTLNPVTSLHIPITCIVLKKMTDLGVEGNRKFDT